MENAHRILVVHAHPAPHRSRVNRRLLAAARSLDGVLVHELYETYPDFFIDAAREQALLAQAGLVVFLHPLRWYAMPALLKEWVDTVFEPDWAYGRGRALAGKIYWLAVSTGSPEQAYAPGERHGRPFADFLAPYEQTARLCGMHWWPPHVLHGASEADDATLDAHAAAFRTRLAHYLSGAPADAGAPHGADHGA